MSLDRKKITFLDFRREIDALVDHFQWFGLRQQDMSKKCSCILSSPEGYISPDPNCKRCLATGYAFTDYLVKGYIWLSQAGLVPSALSVSSVSTVGKLSTQRRAAVLKHEYPVKKYDEILTLDLDPETGMPRQPFRIMNVFVIMDYFPVQGVGGRLEYWTCGIEERNIDDQRPGHVGTRYRYRVE